MHVIVIIAEWISGSQICIHLHFMNFILFQIMHNTKEWGNLWGRGLLRRGPNAFVLATLVSGFTWYFANQQTSQFNARQSELIRRVEQEEIAEDFKKSFNYREPQSWECKKVNLDGVIKDGRFFVKRSRGKQEGYMVLAPFVVNSLNSDTFVKEGYYAPHTSHRKFLINLGWIPKSRKHLVFDTINNDSFGEEVYTERQEALQKQREDGIIRDPLSPELTVPVTNVTAFVRKGESEDRINGRINWKEQYLYKWVDLALLTRVFRVFNEEEGETVFLERTFKGDDDPQSYPIQASKESVIEDLKNQSKNVERAASRGKKGVAALSFGVASWLTFM